MTAPDDDVELQRDIAGLDTGALRRAVDLVRLFQDPVFPGIVISVVAAFAGFGLLLFATLRVEDALYLPLQLPYLISGGLTGIALVMVGTFACAVLSERRSQAAADQQFREIVDEVGRLARLLGPGDSL